MTMTNNIKAFVLWTSLIIWGSLFLFLLIEFIGFMFFGFRYIHGDKAYTYLKEEMIHARDASDKYRDQINLETTSPLHGAKIVGNSQNSLMFPYKFVDKFDYEYLILYNSREYCLVDEFIRENKQRPFEFE